MCSMSYFGVKKEVSEYICLEKESARVEITVSVIQD